MNGSKGTISGISVSLLSYALVCSLWRLMLVFVSLLVDLPLNTGSNTVITPPSPLGPFRRASPSGLALFSPNETPWCLLFPLLISCFLHTGSETWNNAFPFSRPLPALWNPPPSQSSLYVFCGTGSGLGKWVMNVFTYVVEGEKIEWIIGFWTNRLIMQTQDTKHEIKVNGLCIT